MTLGTFRPDWLVRRPIAHRGLHDRASGVVENSLAAARAAMERDYAIECDVQLTADLDAVVFHDFVLDRLTPESGPVNALRADRLERTTLLIVAQAGYDDPEWGELTPQTKRDLSHVLHYGETRPDFLSYHVGDLPHAVPYLCRTAIGIPVMAWTVRTPEQRQRAATWADQMVFEGFEP